MLMDFPVSTQVNPDVFEYESSCPNSNKNQHFRIKVPCKDDPEKPDSGADGIPDAEHIETIIQTQNTIGRAGGRGQQGQAIDGSGRDHLRVPMYELAGNRSRSNTQRSGKNAGHHINRGRNPEQLPETLIIAACVQGHAIFDDGLECSEIQKTTYGQYVGMEKNNQAKLNR